MAANEDYSSDFSDYSTDSEQNAVGFIDYGDGDNQEDQELVDDPDVFGPYMFEPVIEGEEGAADIDSDEDDENINMRWRLDPVRLGEW